MEKLTLEQKIFVENNHNLIYGFAKKKNLSLDDFYDILAIGLCKAGLTYKESVGCKFPTYAYKVMQNEVYVYWSKTLAKKVIPDDLILSGNRVVNTDSDDADELFDLIDSKYDLANEVLSNAQCDFLLNMLEDKERMIVMYVSSGMKHRQIAEVLNCSQQNVSRIVKKVKNKWSAFNY